MLGPGRAAWPQAVQCAGLGPPCEALRSTAEGAHLEKRTHNQIGTAGKVRQSIGPAARSCRRARNQTGAPASMPALQALCQALKQRGLGKTPSVGDKRHMAGRLARLLLKGRLQAPLLKGVDGAPCKACIWGACKRR